uniref:Uncharacterized protein n=1 Tax=Cacopsylla melanoneura TaxID=428564 RepID=A0A8D8VFX6_9HEMI
MNTSVGDVNMFFLCGAFEISVRNFRGHHGLTKSLSAIFESLRSSYSGSDAVGRNSHFKWLITVLTLTTLSGRHYIQPQWQLFFPQLRIEPGTPRLLSQWLYGLGYGRKCISEYYNRIRKVVMFSPDVSNLALLIVEILCIMYTLHFVQKHWSLVPLIIKSLNT